MMWSACVCVCCFFFQAEDGIRYLVRSRGLGDVYKRQASHPPPTPPEAPLVENPPLLEEVVVSPHAAGSQGCLLYTSDAADERSSVDLGGRRIIKKKKN